MNKQGKHRCLHRILLAALALLAVTSAFASAQIRPLDEYVARAAGEAPSYRVVDSTVEDGFRVLQVEFVSQIWQDIPWTHRLFIVVPPDVEPSRTGVLFISGSGSGDVETAGMLEVARMTRMPAAALMDVPNQPLFDDLWEDALMAYTFDQFLEGADPDWLLLFPMTKGAVRALDVFQAVVAQEFGIEIGQFVVAGGSKRGWTTWLTAAVDERVTGIVPMVYNNLNLAAQMELQSRTYSAGASPMIDDYTALDLSDVPDPARVIELDFHIDPYAYVERFVMPKMLLHGTNDPFWPVDALNLYWDDLPGEKYVVNFANGGHDLGDMERALRNLALFTLHVTGEPLLSEVEWALEEREDGLPGLEVKRTEKAVGAALYVASSTSRDFTASKWERLEPRETAAGWAAEPRPLPGHYLAFYMDVEYAIGQGETIALSTPIFVVEPE